ncbi:MAG: imidazole glycerol phosphate synthase subunit HisH [Gallionellaceae bacterium]|nr:imidazole glycerol phosphate synthase subunit HisH [Gallionellaceae bacterium]
MLDIAVVDYGMGNLRSVHNALLKVAPAASIAVTGDPHEVARAARVIFPGQGAMPDCMRELEMRGLREAVLQAARSKPFLGICIGLQMLFEHSAEGDTPGLGILPGKVVRFASQLRDEQGGKLKVPHMGWNQVRRVNNQPTPNGEVAVVPSPLGAVNSASGLPDSGLRTFGGKLDRGSASEHPLWKGIAQDERFYFVHSYYVRPQDAPLVQATSDYPQPFVCAVARDNLFAVQFHPEKSSRAGLTLLQNFMKWDPV